MPFERARTAAKVDDLTVLLRIHRNGDGTFTYDARFDFAVLSADGDVVARRQGDLTPHLTTAQRNGAITLMQDLLTKANAEGV